MHAFIVAFRYCVWERGAFCAVVALSACSIGFVRFAIAQAWLVYPVAILYLSASLLIDNRYSIIPFAPWMALRIPGSDRAEPAQLVAWALVSPFFVWGIFTGRFIDRKSVGQCKCSSVRVYSCGPRTI